ncbi:MAG: amidohydrolase family protein [Acidobacteria bacterium]|nr:amidohydrolase family protein [Acidobacteriota bacterium]
MKKTLLCMLLPVITWSLFADEAPDLRAARGLFEKNLDAIVRHDRDAYAATYVHDSRFAVATQSRLDRDAASFFGGEPGWPDTFEATDLDLVRVAPGVVYGTYRYRITYEDGEHAGIAQRLFIETSGGWKIAVTGAVDSPPGTPPPPRAIVGATLVDGRGGAPVANANVVIRSGRIDCAGTAAQCPVPEGIEVTDAKGMWLTPGLIDAHVHFSQTGWADGRPDALDVRASHPYERVEAELEAHPERYARSYICSGVTSVFDVGGYPWTLRLAERFKSDTLAPRVVAAGPLLSTLDHWLNLAAERQFIAITTEETAQLGVRYLVSKGAKAIKVWYIVSPDLPVEKNAAVVAAAGDEAQRARLPLIVHATGLAEAKASLRAGAKVFVHSVEDLPLDQEFLDLAKQNGTIVIPTLTVIDGYVRMFRGVADRKAPSVDDPNHCVDRATLARVAETATVDASLVKAENLARREARQARFNKVTRENLATLVRAGIPIATGTDAGNPLTLHGPAIYAEMEAMQASGMTPMQVIVASTATASRAMGTDAETGTIEKGKAADLVLLGADPTKDVSNFRRIRFVVRAGEIRDIAYLSKLAE